MLGFRSISILTFILILTSIEFSFAGNSMPSSFTYQGRFMNASGTAPLTGTLTVFSEIRNPSGNCLLYSERQNVNTSDGLFSIRIGEGTRNVSTPGYTDDPNYQFDYIFSNKHDFPTVAASCAGGYATGLTDARILRIHVYDGSTTTTLADQTLSPVPQASVADTIDGVPLQGLTLSWTTATRPTWAVANVTQGFNRTTGRFEIWNGTIWTPTTPKFSTTAINDTATDNYVMKWNDSTNEWEPAAIGTLLGAPGGDVSGTYTNMTVEAIQGQAVAATAPNLGEVLKWNGSAWEAALDTGGVEMATGAGTTNRLTKWNASDELADSSVSDDGTNVTFSIPLVMSTQQIKDVAAPTDPNDAVTLNYLFQHVNPGTADGQILVWDNTAQEWQPAAPSAGGGTTISGGTQNYLSKFNATGDNIVNSAVIDTGATGVNFVNRRIQLNGDLFLHNVGSENTFLGVDAGNTTMSGAGHTAIGYSSGGVTDGAYNTTAVGNQALRDNVSGSNNTAVGALALNAATGGSNTAVGKSSLNGIVAGGANTALGESAGANATAASSNNVFLGHFAGPTAAGAISDRLYIDNSANNTPLIYGDFTDNYVRIHNIFELPEIAAPANPATGYGRFYVKSDGKAYFLNDSGTEYDLTASGGGGGITTFNTLTDATQTLDIGTTGNLPNWVSATGEHTLNIPMASASGTVTAGLISNAQYVRIPAAGTGTNNTLRWDGTGWVESDGLTIESDGDVVLANAPSADEHAATKLYVDTAVSSAGVSGTQNVIPKFNASGDDIIDSSITDNGTNVLFENPPVMRDSQVLMTRNGSNSLFMHTTDTDTAATLNTFVGYSSGNTSVTGGANAGFGYASLTALTTGLNNTGMGVESLLKITTSSNNTAFGRNTLSNITTGGTNTALGSQAGNGADTTSAGNIFLGANSGPNSTAVISNRLYIDNTSTDTPLIYGDLTNDYVRIHNIFELPEIAAPSNPASGYGRFYVKSDGKPYFLNDGGTEYDLAASGGGGSTISGGTQNYIPKFNATGDNIVNSGIIDNGTNGVDFTEGIIQMLGQVVFHPGMGANSTYVGLSAGHAGNSTGGGNTAMGSGAMTPMTSGMNNTAVGYNALNSLATGTNNTAFGKDAGAAINGASTGNVFLGHGAGPTATGAISNKLYIHNSQSNTPLVYGDFSAATLAVNGDLTSTTYYYSSDRRLKENISTLESPLEKILKIRAVEFDWIKSGKHDLGFIAQEIEEIYPDLVTTNENGIKAVKYGNLVSPLVGAVQELNVKCEMSKTQIADIDNRVKTLERKVASIEQKDFNQDLRIEQLRRENEELRQQINELKTLIKK